MNVPRVGIITFIALTTFAVSFALKRNSVSEIYNEAPPGPAAAAVAGETGMLATGDLQRPMRTSAGAPAEFAEGSDTTGLLQNSLSIDDLLDEMNADSGPGFTPIDGGRFAVLLRSDPELRKAIAE